MTTDPRIEEALRLLRSIMPRDVERAGESVLRAVLTAVFERMQLVSREEFDVQREVLSRTREKLTLLEKRLAALEGNQGDRTGQG